MGLMAEHSVYWPGFWSKIEETRSNCSTCPKITPSQAKLPPMEQLVTNFPFEHICVDYMSLNDHQFGGVSGQVHGLACGHHWHHRV
jgi:hypothetical protein